MSPECPLDIMVEMERISSISTCRNVPPISAEYDVPTGMKIHANHTIMGIICLYVVVSYVHLIAFVQTQLVSIIKSNTGYFVTGFMRAKRARPAERE